jgi:outer membrane receptor protein involved in Fe transport
MLRFLWRTDMGRDIGKPSVDADSRPTSYPEEDSHRATLAYDQPGPGTWSRLGFSLSWDEYRLLTERENLPPQRAHTLEESDVFAHDYGARFEAERPVGAFRLLLGVDLSGRYGLHAVNRFTSFDDAGQGAGTTFEESIENARKDDLGVFAGLSTSVGEVVLSAGLRGDWVETTNSGGYFGDRETSQSDASGFFGATLPLGQRWEVSAQVARGFRDALLSDRYYRGISGRGFITGNPDLEPETSLQGDLALRYSTGPLSLALYGYDYRIDDLIERYKEGADYYFRNRGEAEVKGVELEGIWAFGPDLVAQVAVQWQEGEALDDGTPLDGIPPAGVILTLRRAPGQQWWWLGRVGAFDRVDDPGPNEKVIPGYAVVDAGVGYRVSAALEIQLYGRNLLDQSYLASADENSVLEPGRGVQLSLRGRI